MEYRYRMQWPRENLRLETFVHEIFNYRYHWHRDEYELNILMDGRQEYCRGTENFILKAGDVLLVSPDTGHASFAPEPNTLALVLHFSASAFKPYVKKGALLRFSSCRPGGGDEEVFRRIRFCAAQIYAAASGEGPFAALHAREGLSMLLSTLCAAFDPQETPVAGEDEPMETVRHLLGYLEEHYTEKLTLEELAAYAQYNRTYVSTLFKNTVGINFHEYLTRIRLQNALIDLADPGKKLTDVALDNGFADLKSFNKRFRETFGQSPAEYRARLRPDRIISSLDTRRFVSPEDESVRRRLAEYRAGF